MTVLPCSIYPIRKIHIEIRIKLSHNYLLPLNFLPLENLIENGLFHEITQETFSFHEFTQKIYDFHASRMEVISRIRAEKKGGRSSKVDGWPWFHWDDWQRDGSQGEGLPQWNIKEHEKKLGEKWWLELNFNQVFFSVHCLRIFSHKSRSLKKMEHVLGNWNFLCKWCKWCKYSHDIL